MEEKPIPLRVVIKQLGLYPVPNYRIITYGDELKPLHGDFESSTLLIEALPSAIPEFEFAKQPPDPLKGDQGSIVFDGEMMLSSKQRSALGLK